jgi:hypothetical protein
MSRVTVREFHESDLPQVLQGYAQVFGEHAAEQFDRRRGWSLEHNPCPADVHRWVLVDGERVVGFLAALPQYYTICGQPLVAYTPCDYLVAPEYRFHGLQLMKTFVKQCPNCVTFEDVEATIGVNKWLGIKPVTAFDCYVLPLGPRGVWLQLDSATPAELVRSLIKGMVQGRDAHRHVQPVGDFDDSFDRFAFELSERVPATMHRGCNYLRWRYRGDSPQAACTVVAVRRSDGGIDGYAVLHAYRRGAKRGDILDLAVMPGDVKTARMLLGYAVAHFRRQMVASVRYRGVLPAHSATREALRACGFRPAHSLLQLMVKLQSAEHMTVAQQAHNWSLSFGDTENSYSK